MKKILSLLVVAIAAITLVGCAEEKEFDFEQGYITVGLEADYPPFNWFETSSKSFTHKLEGEGYVAGYDVEIAKLIAEELGLELRIQSVTWDALIPSLNSNRIDLVIAGMSVTEERKRSISFTESYYTSTHVVVVQDGGAYSDITDLDGLKGAKGKGQLGTLYADLVEYVATNHGSTTQAEADSVSIIATSILTGVTDFTIVEKPVADALMAAHPGRLKIPFENNDNIFNVSPDDVEVSIGLRKIDSVLQSRINEILKRITTEQRNDIMAEAVKNQTASNGE